MGSLLVGLLLAKAVAGGPALSCAPGAAACRACSKHKHGANAVEATQEEVLALRAFALAAGKSWWIDMRGDHREQERDHFAAMGAWARETFGDRERARPVVYPFGGADLQTSATIFDGAASHTLVDALPVGDAKCFLDAKCRQRATDAAQAWFSKLHTRGFRFSETAESAEILKDVGILPALLVALELLYHRVVGATFWSAGATSGVTLHAARRRSPELAWSCGTFEYVSAAVKNEADWAEILDAVSAPPPWSVLLKAAPRDGPQAAPWFAESLVERASVVVQDATGPGVAAFADVGWVLEPFGAFGNSTRERSEVAHADHGDALAQLYAHGVIQRPAAVTIFERFRLG